MTNGNVSSSVTGGIATITFSHPQSNSLPGTLLRELAAAITEAGKHPEARVIVLQSEGE
ncbi:MAG: enoyl-CoA hydratase/isomerase family protein, partial [Bacteroidia bacterium]|nr:enoyl-CoA hydratase/isomerase family protein [Bacteroidia bacterium]